MDNPNYKNWEKEYDRLELSANIKEVLKEFIKNYSKVYSIIEITDPLLKKGFDMVANYQRVVISFDVEFQSCKMDNDKRFSVEHNIKNDSVATFVREIGILIFVKDSSKVGRWFYLGSILANFKSLVEHRIDVLDTKYIFSTYATVTDKTLAQMEENDKEFKIVDTDLTKINNDSMIKSLANKDFMNKINSSLSTYFELTDEQDKIREERYIRRKLNSLMFDILGKYLKGNHQMVFKKQLDIYNKDPLVKSRVVDEVKFLDLFGKISNYTYFVVKGSRDISAICNSYKLVNKSDVCRLNFKAVYDIEVYNNLSKQFFGNAKLETTYRGLINSKTYKNHCMGFFKMVEEELGNVAHNPAVDSLWTVVVATTIMIGLNRFFISDLPPSNNYYKKYKKYKTKYVQIRREKV